MKLFPRTEREAQRYTRAPNTSFYKWDMIVSFEEALMIFLFTNGGKVP